MNTATLIYDANCPICRRARAWLEARIPAGQIEYLGCQTEERRARFPQIAEGECMSGMQYVGKDGTRRSGSDALPDLLRLTPRWGWAGVLIGLPGLRWLARPAYQLIAQNRLRISAVLLKDEPESCEGKDSCSLR